jgi:hypothetical protein
LTHSPSSCTPPRTRTLNFEVGTQNDTISPTMYFTAQI